jgi:prepilin-type N-terminal cleavage/methylation domain-containing protein
MRKSAPGFTLIELLIVVAIIAILAAIAVPNFLEAQTRSKVSRVQSDFRSIAVALESYMTDNGNFPIGRMGKEGEFRHGNDESYYNLVDLTTPIAYITSAAFLDPFTPSAVTVKGSFTYFNYAGLWGLASNVQTDITMAFGWPPPKIWAVTSYGPARIWQAAEWFPIDLKLNRHSGPNEGYNLIYDPTNGTKSLGSLARFGGEAAVTVMGQ